MFKIGVGAYPLATIQQINNFIPKKDAPVLVMGKPNDERHDFAQGLKAQGYYVIRRHWEADNDQIDYTVTPSVNALNWLNRILGGLSPNQFMSIYDIAVGFNECYSDVTKFAYLCQVEVALCNMLHKAGIKYAWGSIAVGNVDPYIFATVFKPINDIADAICYHGYLAPGNTTIESNFDYLRRPVNYYEACVAQESRMPPVLLGESGTYNSWLNSETCTSVLIAISNELLNWQIQGMIVIGHCGFGIGIEGTMGQQWNITEVSGIAKYNSTVVDYKSITGVGVWVWYAQDDILTKLQNKNLSWVAVKYSDGSTFGDATNSSVFQDQFIKYLPGLKQQGLQVFSYSYIYLDDPETEAIACAQGIQSGADGIIIDIEYEAIGRLTQADTFFTKLRSLIPVNTLICFAPDLRILLGNTNPPWTQESNTEPWPWAICLANCQYIMPQLYISDFQVDPTTVFELVDVYKRACVSHGWTYDTILPIFDAQVSSTDLMSLMQLAWVYHPGASIWRYDDIPDTLWNTIKNHWWINMDDATLSVIGQQIFSSVGVPFNPTAAITNGWIQAWKSGKYLGRPRGTEFVAGNFTCQEFENDIVWAETNNWSNFGYGYKT